MFLMASQATPVSFQWPNGSGVTLDNSATATTSVRIYGSSERTSVARYQINGSNTSAVPKLIQLWLDNHFRSGFLITISSFVLVEPRPTMVPP